MRMNEIGINNKSRNNNMEKTGLIPNKSYENFILGDDITNYLHFVKKKFINLTFTYFITSDILLQSLRIQQGNLSLIHRDQSLFYHLIDLF